MKPGTKKHLIALAATALALAVIMIAARLAVGAERPPIVIDRETHEIAISATVHPEAMEKPFGVRGHHAIVWRNGKSAGNALFRSAASDRQVRRALEALGAAPGENLTLETWTMRDDRSSPDPDLRVEGTPVRVYVTWEGLGRRLPLHEVVRAGEHGVHPDFDFRYGGNERWQPTFRSGCIVCLHSCPGGAIGNRNSTIRQSLDSNNRFHAEASRLPPEGTPVTLILQPEKEHR